MTSVPAWKSDRHGRMEAAWSLLRSNPAPETAMWASPSRARSRPSNLHAGVRSSPSFALSRRDASALRTTVERVNRTTVQSHTTQATQTEAADADVGIHLGAFGDVGTMTIETVDFLIRVLEDRKQELLVNDDGVKERNAASDEEEQGEVARLQLDWTNDGGAGVTGLVRSHSYEALVQLEGILETRHRKIMSDGLLDSPDDNS